MSKARSVLAALMTGLLAACDAEEEVRVQPLPPLERPTPEARARLPEVAGVWRFAGWDLAPSDSAALQRDLPGLGEIQLQTQRLDSIAGVYAAGGGRMPLVGEVRRDSIVSLVANPGGGSSYYLAGEVARDTLWIRLSSLVEPGAWPDEALAAFVRTDVASTFVRLHGTTPPPPVDSTALLAAESMARADSMGTLAASVPRGDSVVPRVLSPIAVPPTAFLSRSGRDAFGFSPRGAEPPPAAAASASGQPAASEGQPAVPAPRPARPAPVRPQPELEPVEPEPVRPADPPRRSLPRLLGEPVRRDTAAVTLRSPRAPADGRGR